MRLFIFEGLKLNTAFCRLNIFNPYKFISEEVLQFWKVGLFGGLN